MNCKVWLLLIVNSSRVGSQFNAHWAFNIEYWLWHNTQDTSMKLDILISNKQQKSAPKKYELLFPYAICLIICYHVHSFVSHQWAYAKYSICKFPKRVLCCNKYNTFNAVPIAFMINDCKNWVKCGFCILICSNHFMWA